MAGAEPLNRRLGRLRRRSRALSRTKPGSRNRAKAARHLSQEHARIANLRRSFLHEISGHLAKTHGRLVVEDLAVANLVRNKHLARAIADAAWAESVASSAISRPGWAPSWSSVTAGFRRPRPVRAAELSSTGWG